jgi:hypothetical protein
MFLDSLTNNQLPKTNPPSVRPYLPSYMHNSHTLYLVSEACFASGIF